MHERTVLLTHNGSPMLSKNAGYLRKFGYHVIEADSEKLCLKLITRQRPPLVMCNLSALCTDGCRCLKQLNSAKTINRPFVVHFSKAKAGAGQRANRSTVDEVLPCPAKPSELLPWVSMFFRFKHLKDFHHAIIEEISESVFLTDDQGHITYVCPNRDLIFGYTESEIYQLGHISHFMRDDFSSIETMDGQGKIQDTETVITGKAGERRTVWVHVKKVATDKGTRLYVCRDISQRVESKAHGAANDGQGTSQYVAHVDDVTERKQIEAQFQHSRKMEAIGTLAGGIAHEFNNILGIIIGNTELAADEIASANMAQDFLAEIRTATRRAKDVVYKILSFARKTTFDPKPVRIGALFEEAARFLRSTIAATINIRTNIQSQAETILADATEMNQILMNLFTNAAHAMPNQQGTIVLGLEPIQLDQADIAEYNDLKPGAYVCLTVSDNGTGIAANDLNRIFDPYFTSKDVDQGTGMGLAVVYGIVKKHGGDIVVRSTQGEGTDVTVMLPLMAETQDTLHKEKVALPTGTESILVVDDEPAIVKMAWAVLKRLGYNVVATDSSAKALAIVEESPDYFDLVITDMAMPGMAGDELFRKLTKIRQKMPIILCTGHSERIDEAGARDMGIRAYVLKPFEKEALAHTVRNVLDQR